MFKAANSLRRKHPRSEPGHTDAIDCFVTTCFVCLVDIISPCLRTDVPKYIESRQWKRDSNGRWLCPCCHAVQAAKNKKP
jgi:hypothetical protein